MSVVRRHLQGRRRQLRHGTEDGQFLAMTVVFMTMFLVLAGLVTDGGRYLDARQTAASDAEQAARAGASSFDVGALRAGQVVLDPATATAAVMSFWSSTGQPGTPSVSATGDSVTVGVSYSVPTQLLGAIGVPSLKVNVSESASAITGISTVPDGFSNSEGSNVSNPGVVGGT